MTSDYSESIQQSFEFLGGESRARAAFAFIPDPQVEITIPHLSKFLDIHTLHSTVYRLNSLGLLEHTNPDGPNPQRYKRVEHPMWPILEMSKIAFNILGVEFKAIADQDKHS